MIVIDASVDAIGAAWTQVIIEHLIGPRIGIEPEEAYFGCQVNTLDTIYRKFDISIHRKFRYDIQSKHY